MPNSAFVADFSSFTAAIDKSIVKIKDLSSFSARAEKDMNRMSNAFSGTDIIRQATLTVASIDKIGGTSKLTAAELQRAGNLAQEAATKMKALGVDVPPKIQALADAIKKPEGAISSLIGSVGKLGAAIGIGFGVSQIISFGREVGSFAGQMIDLERETNITTDRLQAFNFAGAGAGITLESITTSAEQLAKRMGGNDASVVSAFGKLNLNIDDLKQQGLDEVLFRVDEALVGVGNQFEKTRILTDLFGKSGVQMARIMDGSFREVTKAAEDSGAIIDKELLKKADAFDDAWSQAWISFRASAVESVGFVGRLLDGLRDIAKHGIRFEGTPGPVGGLQPVDFTKSKIVGGKVVPIGEVGAGDAVQGAGLPDVDEDARRLREQIDKLGQSYDAMIASVREADSAFRNARGMDAWNADVALMESSSSKATVALQKMVMQAQAVGQLTGNLGRTGGFDIASLMGGPGAMPFGGNLFGTNSGGTPLAGFKQSLAGSIKGFAQDLPQTILGAFQGGGSIKNSIGASLGGALFGSGSGLTKSITGGLTNLLGSTIGGIAGSILPGVGALIGPAITGISKLFGKAFGGEGKQTNDLRDKTFEAAGGFDEIAKKAAAAGVSMDRVLKADKIKDFERAWADVSKQLGAFDEQMSAITQLTDAHAQRQTLLNEAVARYNFTAQEKGPLVNMTEMAKQAELLIQDWQLLVGSSVDVDAVIREMSGSMSEFVQRAIKTGTEIPEAMRDMIVKMIEQGKLLDENGVAFTDLESTGLKFGESLTKMFEGLLKKLDALIDKLEQAARGAANLPTSFVNPDIADQGTEQLPGFAHGTRGKFLSFGAGTPVLLHGRERVSTEAEGRAESGAWTAMATEIAAMRTDMRRAFQRMPGDLASAVLTR